MLYLSLYGKEMLESVLNVKVSPDMTSFTLKSSSENSMKFSILEYIHGAFVGIARSVRECRKSKLLSYNMFFFYNDQQIPDAFTLRRDILTYINYSDDQILANNVKLLDAF